MEPYDVAGIAGLAFFAGVAALRIIIDERRFRRIRA
jgi:hypothetical protein